MDRFIKILTHLSKGKRLSQIQSKDAFLMIMKGAITQAKVSAFLMALKKGDETAEEIVGAVKVLRKLGLKIKAPANAIDTCGTGGDGLGTLNISTAAAIITASCGIPVSKHGNRSITSKSGSADVLSALGVNINTEREKSERTLRDANIRFLMAPNYHSAMKQVAEVRKDLGIRTIFNILGPLLNPAQCKYQLIGVYSNKLVKTVAKVLTKLNMKCAWVVHGQDGLDEITTTGLTNVAEIKGSKIRYFKINPRKFNIPKASLKLLKGGSPKRNAEAIKNMLDGKKGPFRDICLLNAGAAIKISKTSIGLSDGIKIAEAAIESGRAKDTLKKLIKITNNKK